jgi:DNA-binding response OmpR family regulator
MAKVLLVEDDKVLQDTVADFLRSERHEVEAIADGGEASGRLRHYHYDLVVLDWNLPTKEGLDVLKEYRSQGGTTPILMLTGKGHIDDKTTGLDSGADDYLTKPFDIRELSSRVRVLLRRPNTGSTDILTAGSVSLDMQTHTVKQNGEPISLMPKEFALLEFLIRHRNQVFSVDDLLNRVWSSESDSTTDAVRQCITRLRRKLDREGQKPLITTVTGVGYRIDLPG